MLLHDARRGAPGCATARSSRSTSRTVPCGTTSRSARAARCCERAMARGAAGPVRRSRRPSPTCTSTSPATGDRSPRSTTAARPPNRLPVVELNRAIAVAEIDGPEAGLALLDAPRPRPLPLLPLHPRRPAAPRRPRRRGPRTPTAARSTSRRPNRNGASWPSRLAETIPSVRDRARLYQHMMGWEPPASVLPGRAPAGHAGPGPRAGRPTPAIRTITVLAARRMVWRRGGAVSRAATRRGTGPAQASETRGVRDPAIPRTSPAVPAAPRIR